MNRTYLTGSIVLLLASSLGCGLGIEERPDDGNEPASCTSNADCEGDLECVNFRCVGAGQESDIDADGISDDEDNCVSVANPDQLNGDGDQFGDVCDTDLDNDGILNDNDNCPNSANDDQANLDGDEFGDSCDPDDDNDGIEDDADNCPELANPPLDESGVQADVDGDGIGNACDDDYVPPPPCACTERQTCIEETGECIEPDTCYNDVDCNEGHYCVGSSCVPVPAAECRIDSDCDGGTCNQQTLECMANNCSSAEDCPSTMTCVDTVCTSCSDSLPCPGAQQCDAGFCSDALTCSADIDCTLGAVCNTATGACEEPVCGDDGFEPNSGLIWTDGTQSVEAYDSLTSGTYDFEICVNDDALFFDEDWFLIDAQAGDGVIINALHNPNIGFLEMNLAQASPTPIARALCALDYCTVQMGSLPEPPVYVWLTAPLGHKIPVSMTVEVVPGGFCINDLLEPNNTPAQGTDLGTDPVSEYRSFQVCAGDEDWLTTTVTAGNTLDVVVNSHDGDIAHVDIYANGTDEDARIFRNTQPQESKTFSLYAVEDTTYFVRLSGTATGAGSGEAAFTTLSP